MACRLALRCSPAPRVDDAMARAKMASSAEVMASSHGV